MHNESGCAVPTIVLLRSAPRRVTTDEARRVVETELGEEAAATLWSPGGDLEGME